MAENYSENLFEAIDTIIAERLKELPFDRTIIGTIKKQDENDTSRYTVEAEGIVFEALSTNTSLTYSKGQSVLILIKNNDYSEEKIITGVYSPSKIKTEFLKNKFGTLNIITNQQLTKADDSEKLYSIDNLDFSNLLLCEAVGIDFSLETNYEEDGDFIIQIQMYNSEKNSIVETTTIDNISKETIDDVSKETEVSKMNILPIDLYGNVKKLSPEYKFQKIFDFSSYKEHFYDIKTIKVLITTSDKLKEKTVKIKSVNIVFGNKKDINDLNSDWSSVVLANTSKESTFDLRKQDENGERIAPSVKINTSLSLVDDKGVKQNYDYLHPYDMKNKKIRFYWLFQTNDSTGAYKKSSVYLEELKKKSTNNGIDNDQKKEFLSRYSNLEIKQINEIYNNKGFLDSLDISVPYFNYTFGEDAAETLVYCNSDPEVLNEFDVDQVNYYKTFSIDTNPTTATSFGFEVALTENPILAKYVNENTSYISFRLVVEEYDTSEKTPLKLLSNIVTVKNAKILTDTSFISEGQIFKDKELYFDFDDGISNGNYEVYGLDNRSCDNKIHTITPKIEGVDNIFASLYLKIRWVIPKNSLIEYFSSSSNYWLESIDNDNKYFIYDKLFDEASEFDIEKVKFPFKFKNLRPSYNYDNRLLCYVVMGTKEFNNVVTPVINSLQPRGSEFRFDLQCEHYYWDWNIENEPPKDLTSIGAKGVIKDSVPVITLDENISEYELLRFTPVVYDNNNNILSTTSVNYSWYVPGNCKIEKLENNMIAIKPRYFGDTFEIEEQKAIEEGNGIELENNNKFYLKQLIGDSTKAKYALVTYRMYSKVTEFWTSIDNILTIYPFIGDEIELKFGYSIVDKKPSGYSHYYCAIGVPNIHQAILKAEIPNSTYNTNGYNNSIPLRVYIPIAVRSGINNKILKGPNKVIYHNNGSYYTMDDEPYSLQQEVSEQNTHIDYELQCATNNNSTLKIINNYLQPSTQMAMSASFFSVVATDGKGKILWCQPIVQQRDQYNFEVFSKIQKERFNPFYISKNTTTQIVGIDSFFAGKGVIEDNLFSGCFFGNLKYDSWENSFGYFVFNKGDMIFRADMTGLISIGKAYNNNSNYLVYENNKIKLFANSVGCSELQVNNTGAFNTIKFYEDASDGSSIEIILDASGIRRVKKEVQIQKDDVTKITSYKTVETILGKVSWANLLKSFKN